MRRLRWPRAMGCMEAFPAAASEGRSTYFNERNCRVLSVKGLWQVDEETYQEKGIGHKSVAEHSPAHPSSGALSTVGDGCDGNCGNDTNELVTGIRNQIVNLALRVDVEEVPSQPKQYKLKNDDHASIAERDAQQLGLELSIQACDHCGEQDVGGESHDGDVDVGTVDVVSWRQEGCAAAGAGGLVV